MKADSAVDAVGRRRSEMPPGLADARDLEAIVSCLRAGEAPDRVESVRASLRTGLDCSQLLSTSMRHGLTPAVCSALIGFCSDLIPAADLAHCRELFDSNDRLGSRLLREVLEVCSILETHQVVAVPWMRTAIHLLAHGDLGLRQNWCADVLVRNFDVHRVEETLLARGYQPLTAPAVEAPALLRVESNQAWIRRDSRIILRIHWDVAPWNAGSPLMLGPMWDRRQRLTVDGYQLHSFTRNDLLLVACVQGALRQWKRLNLAWDVATLLEAGERIDWDGLLEQSRTQRCERILLCGLSLAQAPLGARLPGSLSSRIDRDPVTRGLAAQARGSLSGQARPSPGRAPSAGPRSSLQYRDGWREKLRYCLRRATSPTMEDVLFMRLPPRLFPFYALVRPFRLATGYVAPSRSRRTTDLGPWLQSPQAAVERMLELAQVSSKDVVYDLGCGDGRIVLEAAATRGARAVGVDISADLIEAGRDTARRRGVEHLVSFALQDAMETDLSPATVVVLYLPPGSVLRLRAKLESELRPGARVVAHEVDIPGWIPERTELMATKQGVTSVYLWNIAGGGAQPRQKGGSTLRGVSR